jgi:hypothetical protein
MAKEPGQKKSLHQLRQEIAHSRDRLAVDISGLQYELDFPLKFRKSFQRNTVWWVSATIVSGALLALMPARTKKVPTEVKVKANSKNNAQEGILGAGLALGALKLAGTLLRPAVTAFIAKKVRESVNPPRYR